MTPAAAERAGAVCDLCQSRAVKVAAPGNEREQDLVRCLACGHLYLHPFPTPEYLARAYAEELSINESAEAQARQRALWRRRYRSTRSFLGGTPGRLLDVGCGEGWYLHEAQADGWQGTGTEYHDAAAKIARERFGLKVAGGDLEAAKFPSGHFDAITLWHVLEHLYSPTAYLKEIRRILKPGGRLVIECPHVDAEHVTPGIHFGYRRLHLHFFSRSAMGRLLQQSGFTVERTSYEDPDAYASVWTSVLHHAVRTAWIKTVNRLSGRHTGSTIRVFAVKA